ncbi:unnamed protein product [Nesidiocoris tenuis]|uniref:Uncharacterized protein n=1 Tax=Nesidiocoris tenuis TaxID=355587 RepID=A0A6H5HC11_9HEMI|nr:unnamed protein product [Nesidiocoris tenuis]
MWLKKHCCDWPIGRGNDVNAVELRRTSPDGKCVLKPCRKSSVLGWRRCTKTMGRTVNGNVRWSVLYGSLASEIGLAVVGSITGQGVYHSGDGMLLPSEHPLHTKSHECFTQHLETTPILEALRFTFQFGNDNEEVERVFYNILVRNPSAERGIKNEFFSCIHGETGKLLSKAGLRWHDNTTFCSHSTISRNNGRPTRLSFWPSYAAGGAGALQELVFWFERSAELRWCQPLVHWVLVSREVFNSSCLRFFGDWESGKGCFPFTISAPKNAWKTNNSRRCSGERPVQVPIQEGRAQQR